MISFEFIKWIHLHICSLNLMSSQPTLSFITGIDRSSVILAPFLLRSGLPSESKSKASNKYSFLHFLLYLFVLLDIGIDYFLNFLCLLKLQHIKYHMHNLFEIEIIDLYRVILLYILMRDGFSKWTLLFFCWYYLFNEFVVCFWP